MRGWHVDILMYHAIADAPGPTSIAPDIFAAQMAALAEAGIPVITMDDLAGYHGTGAPAPYAVVITFDDGFRSFADIAWPVMRGHGFRPIVYLPSGLVGGFEDWRDCHIPPRRIMDWATIGRLAGEGVMFGSHNVSHPDLTTLAAAVQEAELTNSSATIETRLGHPIRHFAPPYGAATPAIRQRIAAHYTTSVGTRLGTVSAGADLYDLPRLEMFYFTDPARWRAHIAGRGGFYLARRKLLRTLRQTALSSFR